MSRERLLRCCFDADWASSRGVSPSLSARGARRSGGEQHIDRRLRAGEGSEVQRRAALPVGGEHRGVHPDQFGRDIVAPFGGGPVQRRAAFAIHRIQIGAGLRQYADRS